MTRLSSPRRLSPVFGQKPISRKVNCDLRQYGVTWTGGLKRPTILVQQIDGMKGALLAAVVFVSMSAGAADVQTVINDVKRLVDQSVADALAADAVDDAAALKDILPPLQPVNSVPTGYPDATNTGPVAGTVFKAATGSMTISKAGTYSGLVVNGDINVTAASGVIIEDSIVTGGGISAGNGNVITVLRCKIDGQGKFAGSAGIQAFGFFEGNDISGHENGIVVQSGSNGWAKGNYVHDLKSSNAQGHFDGIAIQESVNVFLIEGNSVWGRDTSDIFLKGDFGAINDVTVNANLLRIQPGQASKTAFVVNVDGRQQKITGLKVTYNKVERAAFGYMSFDSVAGVVETGNADWETGVPAH